MSRYFTPAFSKFLITFILIIAIAMGVMVFAGSQIVEETQPVDNVALPQ